ncbi:FG-GAP repeat protein [Nocardiopsis sp. CNT-189]|uniref:hypothetical protein n=1 Tax=Nocardiopsis oceanisediminis TaxID=2816862 RepID=UPI003B307C07
MHKGRKAAAAAGAGVLGAGILAGVSAAGPAWALSAPSPAAPGERAEVREDFNGDGYGDLAVGAPEGGGDTGYVTVVYGSAEGLDPAGATVIDQSTPGVPGDPEPGRRFGSHIAARDLDGDGVTDLAVQTGGADTVTALWGAEGAGLSGDGAVLLGRAHHLAGGDFDGDGASDLVFTEYMRGAESSLLLGPFTRDGEPAGARKVDLGGSDWDVFALAAGDVTGDGADDLVAIRSMEEGARPGLFLAGGADGLTREEAEVPEALSAVIGDFDGDGRGDLAYREAPGGVVEGPWTDAGVVRVVYGTPEGPGTRTAEFTQATPGVPGAHEKGDLFGAALAAGDVDGDGRDDLAAGVPGEAIGGEAKAGAAVVLYGSESGLTGAGAQAFNQATAGVPGVAEAGDLFGAAVRLLDADGDGLAGLAASAPGENGYSGAVWSVRAAGGGLDASTAASFGPADAGSPPEQAVFGAVFGNSTESVLWGIEDR